MRRAESVNQLFLALAGASVLGSVWIFTKQVVRVRRRNATREERWRSIALSERIVDLLVLGAVLPAVFLWIGSLVHVSDQERAYYHRTHVEAVADRFEQDATACAAHANRWAEVGQQALDAAEATDVALVEVNVGHANRGYAIDVRCLLQAMQRIVPQRSAHQAHRVAILSNNDGKYPFGIDNGDGVHMSCRTPATSAQANEIRTLLAVEMSRWKNYKTAAADSGPVDVFEMFAHLTSPERFQSDLGDLSPVFSSDGGAAWVSYHPDDRRFAVNPPTVHELLDYCSTVARRT